MVPTTQHLTRTSHFFIGIDRSDYRLDLCTLSGNGKLINQQSISTDPEAMLAWIRTIESQLPDGATACLCIEQPCPGLLNFFSQFDFLVLHLINPITFNRYREAFNTSKAKDDKKDACHLARLVFEKHDLFPRWRPDDPLSRKLETLSEKRRQLVDALEAHQDAPIFKSLPGAGPNLAARLTAFFGTDRTIYPDAANAQCHSGVAPVTKQSGKTHFVHRRYACCKFWRQTFVEWAAQSVMKSRWAKAYYLQQKEKGHRHHSILRSLAYKWIRIVHRCWQSGLHRRLCHFSLCRMHFLR